MATEQEGRESLEEILTPGAMRSPLKLNLVREIERYSSEVFDSLSQNFIQTLPPKAKQT
jgi:hypothetical protein